MLVLALDTTTRAASCAVARDGVVIREAAADPSRQIAVQLPSTLRELLGDVGVTLREVAAFAVATGPGSFTGLRVGIATMQGLAFAESKPLIGVSALDALFACGAGVSGSSGARIPNPESRIPAVATWVDAWRGDVYAALYEDGRATGEPVVAKPGDLLREMKGNMVFIGDGAQTFRELIVATLGDAARIAEPPTPLLAGAIAQMATDVYVAGHRPPAHAIRPLYVRRPDPELARGNRGPHGSAPRQDGESAPHLK